MARSALATLALPPRALARRARLRYASDESPGIRRVTRGRGFGYVNAQGRPVRDRRTLARIHGLVIPPAWTDVWICPQASGHLQATGRDARGRKQYLYHTQWMTEANRAKFAGLAQFGKVLPALRAQVARHLALPELSRNKVVATVIALLDRTLVRVGNEEYARSNSSFGLTTLRDRHAKIERGRLLLRFRGKSGQQHDVEFHDRRVARIVRACQELPGQQLFQYRDERGIYRRLESADVNRYLQDATGFPFTAKSFRTWKATALALELLLPQSGHATTKTESRRAVRGAICEVAEALGNTATICRNYYIHPQIIELFEQGDLVARCGALPRRARKRMSPHEQLLLRLLGRLERKGSRRKAA
jgi:DNA topoisomerase-1